MALFGKTKKSDVIKQDDTLNNSQGVVATDDDVLSAGTNTATATATATATPTDTDTSENETTAYSVGGGLAKKFQNSQEGQPQAQPQAQPTQQKQPSVLSSRLPKEPVDPSVNINKAKELKKEKIAQAPQAPQAPQESATKVAQPTKTPQPTTAAQQPQAPQQPQQQPPKNNYASNGNKYQVDPPILKFIPEASAKYYRIVPLEMKDDNVLVVGTTDPKNIEAIDALNFISTHENIDFQLVKINEDVLEAILKQYSETTSAVQDALSEYQKSDDYATTTEEEVTFSSIDQDSKVASENAVIRQDAPITKMVNNLLIRGVDINASDIHVEPYREKLIIRYRVDGVLARAFSLPRNVHSALTAQLKIRSRIRLDEKRIPQDGRFTAGIKNKKIDFRVATLPTPEGEKVVLRLLDSSRDSLSYEDIGFEKDHIDIVKEAIAKPYGMILSSGPTGSGKTTTMYSILTQLDREKKNIVSLENPVEYNIEGINQSEIRPEIGYTFANGLRSILRGDPDVIFVGEIRDKETAALAVQAALTGHQVFSTIHTNSAVGVIPRLIDMGVDPYLIAPALTAVFGQRLVRRLCDGVGKEFVPHAKMKQQLESVFEDLPEEFSDRAPKIDKLYQAQPTPKCPTGMKGRVAVLEGFLVDDQVEELIFGKPSELKVYELVRKKGMLTMYEDAIRKAAQGTIPYTEINTIGQETKVGEKEGENGDESIAPAVDLDKRVKMGKDLEEEEQATANGKYTDPNARNTPNNATPKSPTTTPTPNPNGFNNNTNYGL
ncbi:MAG: GspE/PulE family protein [Candidatus Campbellbacteria bacterium]|nr:GspE/PulE family protein [Candidatus Campbellbacteria bacterium]